MPRQFSEEHKRKLSESKKGSKNPMYGMYGEKNPFYGKIKENPTYSALHKWVKSRFPKPELCMLCGKVPPKQKACLTGIYNRDLKNWAWLCQSCHMRWDNVGRRNKIKKW
ncbi:MAG TPA: NUMOD3 domain-containing DNA-binding protein [Nitrososphaeraceae archaeon]|nr:NUMOD3 domain-containing DNA-binding protein [Nitrososphaeraceae archaeon]